MTGRAILCGGRVWLPLWPINQDTAMLSHWLVNVAAQRFRDRN